MAADEWNSVYREIPANPIAPGLKEGKAITNRDQPATHNDQHVAKFVKESKWKAQKARYRWHLRTKEIFQNVPEIAVQRCLTSFDIENKVVNQIHNTPD
jgi:hypothetical protein